jgi:hypothetical protein
VRERGVQSRRVRAGNVEPARRPAPPSGGGTNFWQALAIIALIAATAGWTTVAALALRGNTPPAAAVASDDPNAADASVPPDVPSHDVPDLEAYLPNQINGSALDVESWTGDHVFTDGDDWSTTLTTYLTGISKTPVDLQYAYASDPSGTVAMNLGAYRVAGVTDTTGLHDALVKTWQAFASDIKISQATLDGKPVTKGDDGSGDLSYLYVRGSVVFEILTGDEATATTALGALPIPGASGAPAPSGSAAAPSSQTSAGPSPTLLPEPSGSPAP